MRARATAALAEAGLAEGEVALDVGGGPGRHAAAWVGHRVRAVVIDPAAGMLARAGGLAGVIAVGGRAESLPIASGCVGLVYFHLSIHHTDWRRAVGEARRVLRPGGLLCVWTIAPGDHATSGLARWFPSVVPLDAARFPEPEDIGTELRRLGFGGVGLATEEESKHWESAAWQAAVRAGFVSTLQLLPPGELEAGLAAFAAAHPAADEEFHYTLRFTRVDGRATSLP